MICMLVQIFKSKVNNITIKQTSGDMIIMYNYRVLHGRSKYKDIKKVLDEHHEEAEWISASRLKRESYAIKGSDGKLKFKINLRDFQRDIIKCL